MAELTDEFDKDLCVSPKEISEAKQVVLDALNTAFAKWSQKQLRWLDDESNTILSMRRTHKLVVDYIEAILSDSDTIPMVG